MSQITMIALNELKVTETNARRDHVADKAMIASIKSQGLLYPLLVEPIFDGTGEVRGYDVVDGARRLTCILKGLESGELEALVWHKVPCILGNGDGRTMGLEQSLHANLHQSMHPLDECEAILKLSRRGEETRLIALRFGKTEAWLDQRVKLAQLCPEAKELFRKGEIGLGHAEAFTLGTEEAQRAFLKAHKEGFRVDQIRPAMTGEAISVKNINFDLALYPVDKIQRDLFSEEVFLTDRRLVAELQDQWAQEEIERLKAEGYDSVAILAQNDWSTLDKHVLVTGRITQKTRGQLKCFLKADHYGRIEVYKDRALRKQVDAKGKIIKHEEKHDEADAKDIKPETCNDLSTIQKEIVAAHAASSIYTRAVEGDELLLQYLVIENQFGQRGGWTEGNTAFAHNGTRMRWERVNKAYPKESDLIQASELPEGVELESFSYGAFARMSKKVRDQLYREAVASMVLAPSSQLDMSPNLKELEGEDWLIPGEEFFKRFTVEQLIDYRQRCGDKEAGKTVKKKADHVSDCVVASSKDGAYKFGLYKPIKG